MAEQPFWSYHCNLTTKISSFWAWSEPFTFSMLVFSPTFQKCARVILPSLYTLTTTINLEKVFSYLDQRKVLINLIIGASQLNMALHYPSILFRLSNLGSWRELEHIPVTVGQGLLKGYFNLESPVNPTQLSACLWTVGGTQDHSAAVLS